MPLPTTFEEARETKTLYARRGFGVDGQPTTFISRDAADKKPAGWVRGWFAEGHTFGPLEDALAGCSLTHVYEPSWRVSAPVRLDEQAPLKAVA